MIWIKHYHALLILKMAGRWEARNCCFSESFSHVLAAGVWWVSSEKHPSSDHDVTSGSGSSPTAGPGCIFRLHHVLQCERHWCEPNRKCDLILVLSLWLRRLFLKENKSSCRLISPRTAGSSILGNSQKNKRPLRTKLLCKILHTGVCAATH